MTVPLADRSGVVSVAFFGNVANTLFDIALALRDEPDLDAHLYVAATDTARPEDADPSVAGADWIHHGDWITPTSLLAPWRAPITEELARHDLVVVSGPGPIFGQWTGRPWCWWVSGGDLTVKPFPFTFWHRYPDLRHRLGEVVAGAWQRRAARRADQVWIQPFSPMTEAADRLRVPSQSISNEYFPLVIDVDAFRPDRPIGRPDDPTVRRMLAADLTVFHPSRLVMSDTPELRRTGQLKANDVLIEGFARFACSGVVETPLLVMPDSTMSADLEAAKRMVVDLGIEDFVLWATPPRPEGFPRHDLLDLYTAADVVADDFGIGWFGYVALEGLASGKPVVTHVDDAVMQILYDTPHPFCEAATPAAVARQLELLATDPAARATIARHGRDWVVANHSEARTRSRYVDTIRSVALGSDRVGQRPRS